MGGIEKLRVPLYDADLPQPRLPDGSVDPRFAITEAKRYLGKQLYFDPVRTTNIQPKFGGVPITARTASCGSCHLGEAAGKAGTVLNLAVGAEGRGYADANGRFHPRRRILPGLVDTIPTPTELFDANGMVVMSGRFDAVDSVPRLSPSMLGFAFNNRLLLGGKAGEPATSPGASNPNNLPAGENLAEIALKVHRMVETQAATLQTIPVYVELFREAFPNEAALAEASGDLGQLINDDTIARAIATFLRTTVTRETPWDRLLAGNDDALTPRQLRGAALFFEETAASGANCVSCHSGPMLNKQPGDEEGRLVEENFYNIGVGDHPLQALNAQVLQNPGHHDVGRAEITGNSQHAFKFRVLTLRQLKDGGQFMHNASFTSVRDVVEYFNSGVPQEPVAAAAGTLTSRFTHPRGAGFPPGLGLDPADVDALTDFLENALYDPAFRTFDPGSPTRTFEMNVADTRYSVDRPHLAALGAVDGRMASGLAPSNDDALSRRDRGLEFLDVTTQIQATHVGAQQSGFGRLHTYRLTNVGSTPIDTHLLVMVEGLSSRIELANRSGVTASTPQPGEPFIRIFLEDGVLEPGDDALVSLLFRMRSRRRPIDYTLTFFSGQGEP